MKITLLSLVASFSLINGFTPTPVVNPMSTKSSSTLHAINDRRGFLKTSSTVATTAFVGTVFPTTAFAADYVPKFDDIKVLYSLGVSLDKLAAKCGDPDQAEAALTGLTMFNKDPNFYPGYARNYISKTVKNNADGDVRVGYVRQACNGISSIQDLLEGRQGLTGKEAADEAVKRVRKAQALLAKFFAGSGVEDEKIASFIAAHSS